MKNIIPRVAAIHDISGIGRCSLTVIIPVMSALGIQVCPLPTAVLSTHPGGFGNFYFHDLTDHIEAYAAHWNELNMDFDCIYSGFLGSSRQIDIVLKLLKGYKEKDPGHQPKLIVVDPVMGDHGRLYKIFTSEMKNQMKLLINAADIITPNFTEACFLLDEMYTDNSVSTKKMKYFLKSLAGMGPDVVVITSVKSEEGTYANIGYDKHLNTYWKIPYEYVPKKYPGTGDIFTSVLTGNILKGESLSTSIDLATNFVYKTVKTTYESNAPEREGVLLEICLTEINKKLTDIHQIVLE